MGIPWYFYTVYKKYNTENDLTIDEENISKTKVDCLFLDYNSMIHPCAQQILQTLDKDAQIDHIEDMIIKNCINYTRYILNVIKPNCLYVMIDGVAPRAKINQQRERRYKSHFFKDFDQLNSKEAHQELKVNWNSNKITPGTTFMQRLSETLQVFKTDVIKDCCYLESVVISDSDEHGEGEHKMMKHITNIGDKKICIYGLDADLIMLSLTNKNSNNIILIRDNTFNGKLSDKDRVYTYVDIKLLKKYICKDLKTDINSDISDDNVMYDYIFLCFLLGNDFLENIPSLMIKEGGLNVLVKYYSQLVNTKYPNGLLNIHKLKSCSSKNDVEDTNVLNDLSKVINKNMLKDLFYHLSKTEELFFRNIYSAYKKKSYYRDVYDIDMINECTQSVFIYKQDYIKYNQPGYKQRYYKYYNILDEKQYCQDYIVGLYWVLGYYNNHCHNNWTWYYNHHATPFASDIFQFLLDDNSIDLSVILPSKPISPSVQLLMVLPKSSLLEIMYEKDRIIYEKLYRVFNTRDKQLNEYYPDKIYLDMINKEFLWQAKIFLTQFNNQIIDIFL